MLARLSLAAGKRRFRDLSEQEVLALAISSEEEDGRIYAAYAAKLRAQYPASAAVFDGMAAEEDEHRRRLIELYQQRFGDFIVPLRREHMADFYTRRPIWLVENLGLERIRQEAADMEREAHEFYVAAAGRSTDVQHASCSAISQRPKPVTRPPRASSSSSISMPARAKTRTCAARRQLVLTWIQPGLAGLMDGSVSTLAPIFATAFATQNPWTTFLVGLSASVGAGISMGFTEAAHDDGKLSGRGAPWKRGLASGIMTTLGGLGHALPYLIPSFWTATTIALIVVFFELWAIAWIQNRYMETPFLRAAFQVVLGGSLVLAAGILIGGA